jgi:hypothetical protein
VKLLVNQAPNQLKLFLATSPLLLKRPTECIPRLTFPIRHRKQPFVYTLAALNSGTSQSLFDVREIEAKFSVEFRLQRRQAIVHIVLGISPSAPPHGGER